MIRDEGAFSMVFQPIVALESHTVVGVEALARFSGPPDRAPNVWFAEATTVGLGVELELAAVAKALAALHELPNHVYLTINVSPTTLAHTRFHALIEAAGGEQLVAEITEHALVENYNGVVGAVGKLRAMGMRLAVDDAGAGFASFRHILNLHPDLIKLDLTLIRAIDRDCSRQALAASLISFADNSGATIIAEGIEHTAELKKLVELGVSYGQGYLLGRPASRPLGRVSSRRSLVGSTHH
jgi:EAL domain-containing protein (putative c-di-GMP-specific phosphodiesterase class I)